MPEEKNLPNSSADEPSHRLQVNTGGAVYVGGSVDTGGGTFVGRDQVIINIASTLVGEAEIRDIEDLLPEPGDPPFQGLQYYDEKDAERFFGREQLIARIIARLHRTNFLAIIGASGSGKSSLIRAGVIPALRSGQRLIDGGLPPTDSGQWGIQVITPTAHPMDALAASFVTDSDSVAAIATLRDEMIDDPRTLSLAVQRYLAVKQRKHVMLFIDQFEELFTLCRKREECQAFLANLLEAVTEEGESLVTVIIALRADYYAQVSEHENLRQIVSQYQEFIGAMSHDELVRAIDRPLALGNWKIQEGLIEVILDDIGYEPGALPLLSHALHETWLRRRGHTLTLSGYTESGGVRGAIAQTAESVFQRLPAEQQPIARMIFTRMAEVGEDAHDTRRRAAYTELITRSTDELIIDTVIEILAEARLVITSTIQSSGTKVVEVAHEALIQEWPTLQEWLDTDREGLILHQHLTDDTNDWIKLERDSGVLYRGARLERALAWSEVNPELISLLEQEFLESSSQVALQEADQARRLARSKRTQQIFIGITVVLVVAIAYLAYNFFFNQELLAMDGFFNIAIAELGEINQGSSGSQSASNSTPSLNDTVFSTLDTELRDNPNILVWQDNADLREANVTIGKVSGSSPEERTQSAAEIAERLNADMLIFSTTTGDQDSGQLNLEFYLAPQQDYNYEDLQGNFQLGCSHVAENQSFEIAFADCANVMAQIALGLTEVQLGHSLEALEAFLSADQLLPGSANVQFLIGREYLFLVEREKVLEFAMEEFEEQAEEKFIQSTEIDPDFARGYIGLGSVYFKRAQRQLSDEAATAGTPDFTQSMQYIDQSIAAYSQALLLGSDASEYGIPIESVANLSLGNSFRLKGEIIQRQGESDLAMELFDQSIEVLVNTIQPFEQTRQARYLTQAYEYLGNVYQWKAHTHYVNQDYESSLEAYNQSLEYYDKCISQGISTQDLIIKQDIVEGRCTPSREDVKQMLDNLGGAQG